MNSANIVEILLREYCERHSPDYIKSGMKKSGKWYQNIFQTLEKTQNDNQKLLET